MYWKYVFCLEKSRVCLGFGGNIPMSVVFEKTRAALLIGVVLFYPTIVYLNHRTFRSDVYFTVSFVITGISLAYNG